MSYSETIRLPVKFAPDFTEWKNHILSSFSHENHPIHHGVVNMGSHFSDPNATHLEVE
jgi:hypothetical protein